MRVVVTEAFSAYLNMQREQFSEGQKIKGFTAAHFLRTRAAVEPDDDEAHALVDELAAEDDAALAEVEAPQPPHREPCVDGSVCGDEHCPPPEDPGLDIGASAADVLAWVGEDQERAAEALTAEQAKDKPRSTLVKQLEKLAG